MSISILGVRIDNVTMEEAVARVGEMIEGGGKHYLVTPNPEFLVEAQRDKEFGRILSEADLSIPDGVGLLAAAKYLTFNLSVRPWFLKLIIYFIYGLRVGGAVLFDRGFLEVVSERVSGSDLVSHLIEEAARQGGTVFLLGARGGVAERASQLLAANYPGLRVLGAYSGDPAPHSDKEVRKSIEKLSGGEHIDLLFVAYGHQKQEKWIARNLSYLDVSVAMGVGGAFDFISGEVRRAPRWLQSLGLEWFFRLLVQPWRWRRIFKAVVVFPWLVFKEKLTNAN